MFAQFLLPVTDITASSLYPSIVSWQLLLSFYVGGYVNSQADDDNMPSLTAEGCAGRYPTTASQKKVHEFFCCSSFFPRVILSQEEDLVLVEFS